MAKLDELLEEAIRVGASDMHVASGSPLIIRRFGMLRPFTAQTVTAVEARSMIYEILSPTQKKILETNLQLDFSYELKGLARFRGNVISQRRGMDATFRIVPFRLPSFEELHLPEVVARFCDFHQGLILVTGATGQGKTTTQAAMVDLINSNRPLHILTIEDPVEFVHPAKVGVVNQRQLGSHTRSFANALRAALREDPDVIMVGELRDLESISLAVTAAETGHLVIGTLATSSGPKTVDRIIDSYPPNEQNQIRTMLAESLRAVITQRLMPRIDGEGRVLACEIMTGTVPLANMIRTEKTHMLHSVMQTGRHLGMQTMDDAIDDLLQQNLIDRDTAVKYSENKRRFY